MNLAEWARLRGIRPDAACRWFREGALPVPAVQVNSRPVLVACCACGTGFSGGCTCRIAAAGERAGADRAALARAAFWNAAGGPGPDG